MRLLGSKAALVSGGTFGIGEAAVHALAENGSCVAFCGRSAESGKAIEKNCTSKGYNVKFIQADMLVPEDNRIVIDETVKTFGHIDILLANAGGGGKSLPLEEMSFEDWQHDLKLYIHSPFLLAKYAIPYMQKQGTGGSILFMSSASAYKLSPKMGGYASGKSANWQMARQISLEYCREGIRANCILPAATRTKMISDDPAIAAMVAARANARKYNELKDVTDAVLFLASDAARAVTGTQVIVDFASSAGVMPDLIAGTDAIAY